MNNIEVIDKVSEFLGYDEGEVAIYFESAKSSYLKYGYMQQIYIEN
jgi:hypothetical protein